MAIKSGRSGSLKATQLPRVAVRSWKMSIRLPGEMGLKDLSGTLQTNRRVSRRCTQPVMLRLTTDAEAWRGPAYIDADGTAMMSFMAAGPWRIAEPRRRKKR